MILLYIHHPLFCLSPQVFLKCSLNSMILHYKWLPCMQPQHISPHLTSLWVPGQTSALVKSNSSLSSHLQTWKWTWLEKNKGMLTYHKGGLKAAQQAHISIVVPSSRQLFQTLSSLTILLIAFLSSPSMDKLDSSFREKSQRIEETFRCSHHFIHQLTHI